MHINEDCIIFNQMRRHNSIYTVELKHNTNMKHILTCSLTTKIITKFTLSNHYLPIEKGRYVKPILDRNQRLCAFCKSHVGHEIHVLFECEHYTIKNINTKYHNEITKISNQFHNLPIESKLNDSLGATDKDIIPTTGEWLSKINQLLE